ncbi:MAG: hypothetical protein GX756_05170 [Clostridiales bacterium]|nr:hypothetical protein [Clostridiales bacterium]
MTKGEDTFYDISNLASMSECTGLIPSGIENDEEAENYGELYSIHKNKKRNKYNKAYKDESDLIDL